MSIVKNHGSVTQQMERKRREKEEAQKKEENKFLKF